MESFHTSHSLSISQLESRPELASERSVDVTKPEEKEALQAVAFWAQDIFAQKAFSEDRRGRRGGRVELMDHPVPPY